MKPDEQTLSDANVFAAIVRAGNFAKAGRFLNLSQSNVSRSVARLEKKLGVRVFDRTTRSVSLTEDGRNLFEKLEPLLEGFEQAFSSVAEAHAQIRGRLRVKMHPTVAHLINGVHLKAFLENYPELAIEFVSSDKLGDLIGEGIDIALHAGELSPSSLIARKLLDTHVMTVAAPSYLRAHSKITHPRDLLHQQHTLIDYRNPENGKPFQWEFHRGRKVVRIDTKHHATVSDIVTLHGLCAAGWGIAQVLELAAMPMLKSGSLVALLPEWSDERFPIYAVHPSRSYTPPKVRAFLDFLSSAIRKQTTRAPSGS